MRAGRKEKLPALHIIRRQAARILRTVLKGNAEHRAIASIKSLIYKPSIVSKKATFALVCQTLKYLNVIREVLDSTDFLQKKYKGQLELFYVLAYDLLFEQEILPSGEAEALLLSRKSAIKAGLVRLLLKKNVTDISGLLPSSHDAVDMPRYVRVNILKMSMADALENLKTFGPERDVLIPHLITLPCGTDLHDHPLVLQGSLFLQGKASCMPAHVLQPDPNWEVLDACAAPGNKTVHLAALMKGRGRVIACELNKKRLETLQQTVERAGANNVEVIRQDFLKIDPKSSKYCKIRGILLDPSCSGSGTAAQRLDHLLPVSNGSSDLEMKRIASLTSFQKAALHHALSFPAVERVVYSTCSVNRSENEDVILSVMKHAESLHFQLETVFPEWPHRGLPVFDGAQHLLRTDASRDKTDGFFIALFTKSQQRVDFTVENVDLTAMSVDLNEKKSGKKKREGEIKKKKRRKRSKKNI